MEAWRTVVTIRETVLATTEVVGDGVTVAAVGWRTVDTSLADIRGVSVLLAWRASDSTWDTRVTSVDKSPVLGADGVWTDFAGQARVSLGFGIGTAVNNALITLAEIALARSPTKITLGDTCLADRTRSRDNDKMSAWAAFQRRARLARLAIIKSVAGVVGFARSWDASLTRNTVVEVSDCLVVASVGVE